MAFAESPGGKVTRQLSPRQRKLNTLFGHMLENGNKGFLQAQIMLLEWGGILLAPVTLGLRLALHVWDGVGRFMWS